MNVVRDLLEKGNIRSNALFVNVDGIGIVSQIGLIKIIIPMVSLSLTFFMFKYCLRLILYL